MKKTFGKYLAEQMKEKKLGVVELGKLAKVSPAYISRIINENRNPPSAKIIYKLAIALKMDYEILLEVAGYLERPSYESGVAENKTAYGAPLADPETLELIRDFKEKPHLRAFLIAVRNLPDSHHKKLLQMIQIIETPD
ncbi:MAG: helix-turn-helix transcriptional regulator [Negativicutes bacterium]|nr:helix-turn-helix transcriptional regulator [Negativicutes bacterium]